MLSKGTSLGQYHLSTTTQGKHTKLPPRTIHDQSVDLKYGTGVSIALNPRQPYSAPPALSTECRAKRNAQTLPWPCTGRCKTQALCLMQTLHDCHAYTVNHTPSPNLQRDTSSRCLCPTPGTKYTPVKLSQQQQAIKSGALHTAPTIITWICYTDNAPAQAEFSLAGQRTLAARQLGQGFRSCTDRQCQVACPRVCEQVLLWVLLNTRGKDSCSRCKHTTDQAKNAAQNAADTSTNRACTFTLFH